MLKFAEPLTKRSRRVFPTARFPYRCMVLTQDVFAVRKSAQRHRRGAGRHLPEGRAGGDDGGRTDRRSQCHDGVLPAGHARRADLPGRGRDHWNDRGVGIAAKRRINPMQSRLPMHRSPRCDGRTRNGSRCRSPAMPNGRCRMHGGVSPGTPKGNRECRQARPLYRQGGPLAGTGSPRSFALCAPWRMPARSGSEFLD
jgi:hypothetical protein